MKFGDHPIDEAQGAILAHATRVAGRTLKKGRRLSADDIAALRAAGVQTVVAARLDMDDLDEDSAATRVAAAVAGAKVETAAAFTGRVNLFAATPGVLVVDRARLDRLNLVDESITVATLEPYAVVEPKQMLATIKVIPFAAPAAIVDRCAAIAREAGPLLSVAPFRPTAVTLIQTMLPGIKDSVLDKTAVVTAQRLARLGSSLAGERRCGHRMQDLAAAIGAALADAPGLVLIAGASAIVDRRDVIPAAIEASGGMVEHFGMPVDPGNLMLLGRVGAVPVLGLPGCARSPKLNGFDWVLQRLLAGIPVDRAAVMKMGAGGLLAEIPLRGLPRAGAVEPAETSAAPRAPRLAALVLAAGQSRRMGARNKLLIEIGGRPMVRHVVDAVTSAGLGPVVVVLGHEAPAVRAALAETGVTFVENPDFADGLSTSLRRGLSALPDGIEGALIGLGDMPFVGRDDIARLVAAFNPLEGRAIIVPTSAGKRGNPVLWASRFFPEMHEVSGDTGARHLIGAYPELVTEIELGSDSVLVDVDTPETLAAVATRILPAR